MCTPIRHTVASCAAALLIGAAPAGAQIVVKANDDVNFKLGILGQFQADTIDNPDPEPNTNNLFVRRLRLIFGGQVAKNVSFFAETDVLVVGGGPAGTAAAISAARLGADVLLVERYNHLGGLSTGGLVIWIDRMSDWAGKHIIRGFASDIMDRLPKEAVQGPRQLDWGSKDAASAAYWAQRTAAFHGIVTWSPTVDPEALKTVSMQMVSEAKVRLLLHAWAVAPILEGNVNITVVGCCHRHPYVAGLIYIVNGQGEEFVIDVKS